MQGPCARCATCKVGTAVEVTCCSHGSMKSHQARSLEHGWGTKPPCGRATRQWKRAGIESGRWVGSVEEVESVESVESVVFTSCWRGVKRQGRAHYRQSGRIVKRHLSAALAGETRPRTAAAHAGYAPCGLIDVQAGDALRVRCLWAAVRCTHLGGASQKRPENERASTRSGGPPGLPLRRLTPVCDRWRTLRSPGNWVIQTPIFAR